MTFKMLSDILGDKLAHFEALIATETMKQCFTKCAAFVFSWLIEEINYSIYGIINCTFADFISVFFCPSTMPCALN